MLLEASLEDAALLPVHFSKEKPSPLGSVCEVGRHRNSLFTSC